MSPPARGARAPAALLAATLLACAEAREGPEPEPPTTWFRDVERNRGSERYSAWYGDSDGRVLYFGLSPFWSLWWETGGDPRLDLGQPGDHLIGRFDLERERHLPPLRLRRAAPQVRSSVWDVLVHSNGRLYYTTFFEALGSCRPDGTEARRFPELGPGLNELAEGPDGALYVTRYSDAPEAPERQRRGGLVVLSPRGRLLREIPVEPRDGHFRAPKSVAVDPLSGEIWLNLDVFDPAGEVSYEMLHLDASGRLVEARPAPPELHFAAFDAQGRGWFAEAEGEALLLRVRRGGRELAAAPLGTLRSPDFVQDIKFGRDGVAALALWSRRVFLARLGEEGLAVRELALAAPPECLPPLGRSLLYTAVPARGAVFATLFCGSTVLRRAIPAPGGNAWGGW